MIGRVTTEVSLSTLADVDPILPFHFESDVELDGQADAVFFALGRSRPFVSSHDSTILDDGRVAHGD